MLEELPSDKGDCYECGLYRGKAYRFTRFWFCIECLAAYLSEYWEMGEVRYNG